MKKVNLMYFIDFVKDKQNAEIVEMRNVLSGLEDESDIPVKTVIELLKIIIQAKGIRSENKAEKENSDLVYIKALEYVVLATVLTIAKQYWNSFRYGFEYDLDEEARQLIGIGNSEPYGVFINKIDNEFFGDDVIDNLKKELQRYILTSGLSGAEKISFVDHLHKALRYVYNPHGIKNLEAYSNAIASNGIKDTLDFLPKHLWIDLLVEIEGQVNEQEIPVEYFAKLLYRCGDLSSEERIKLVGTVLFKFSSAGVGITEEVLPLLIKAAPVPHSSYATGFQRDYRILLLLADKIGDIKDIPDFYNRLMEIDEKKVPGDLLEQIKLLKQFFKDVFGFIDKSLKESLEKHVIPDVARLIESYVYPDVTVSNNRHSFHGGNSSSSSSPSSRSSSSTASTPRYFGMGGSS